MLTLKKSSFIGRWYKFVMKYGSDRYEYEIWENLSLCKVFQNMFWRSLLVLAMFLILGALILGVVITILMIVISPYFYLLIGGNSFLTLSFIAVVSWLMFVIIAISELISERDKKRIQKLREKGVEVSNLKRENSQVRLFVEYVKAKKDKVCPRINVIE